MGFYRRSGTEKKREAYAGHGRRYHRSEMGTVYTRALGSEIDVVEMFDEVIPAADREHRLGIFTKRISKKFNLMLETKVTAVEAKKTVSTFRWKAKAG